MSKPYKKDQGKDPLYTALDGLFKGIGWLAMLPFKGFGNRGPSAQQLAKVKQEYTKHWQMIESEAGNSHQLRHAIMQADILLDKALEFKGISGATIGDRLKAATDKLSKATLDTAWDAHKVRNRLAHELNYQISEGEARRVLGQFKSVLRALGVL